MRKRRWRPKCSSISHWSVLLRDVTRRRQGMQPAAPPSNRWQILSNGQGPPGPQPQPVVALHRSARSGSQGTQELVSTERQVGKLVVLQDMPVQHLSFVVQPRQVTEDEHAPWSARGKTPKTHRWTTAFPEQPTHTFPAAPHAP